MNQRLGACFPVHIRIVFRYTTVKPTLQGPKNLVFTRSRLMLSGQLRYEIFGRQAQ
jgi:hypothetical protein